MRDVEKGYVGTSAGDVHYRAAGDGRPLVMLQLTPRASEQYEAALPHLARRGYRCVALDLMGYGRSDKRDRPWSVSDFAANVEEALRSLGLAPTRLVAGHFTTLIALELLVGRGAPVAALVLDGTPAWTPEQRADRQHAFKEPAAWSADGAHWREFWNFAWGFIQRQDPAFELNADTQSVVLRLALTLLESQFPPTAAAAIFGYDPLPLLSKLEIPVLAISSATDSLRVCHPRVMSLVPRAREHVFAHTHPLYAVGRPELAGEYAAVIDAFFLGTAA